MFDEVYDATVCFSQRCMILKIPPTALVTGDTVIAELVLIRRKLERMPAWTTWSTGFRLWSVASLIPRPAEPHNKQYSEDFQGWI